MQRRRPTAVAGPGARRRRRRQGALRPVGGDRLQDRRGPLVEGISGGVVPVCHLRGRYVTAGFQIIYVHNRLYETRTHASHQICIYIT